jgi:hypothetical protein
MKHSAYLSTVVALDAWLPEMLHYLLPPPTILSLLRGTRLLPVARLRALLLRLRRQAEGSSKGRAELLATAWSGLVARYIFAKWKEPLAVIV